MLSLALQYKNNLLTVGYYVRIVLYLSSLVRTIRIFRRTNKGTVLFYSVETFFLSKANEGQNIYLSPVDLYCPSSLHYKSKLLNLYIQYTVVQLNCSFGDPIFYNPRTSCSHMGILN